ncbi:MAG: hypothetical protein V1882_06935 [Candidatus Omnitrophota bacterium]
MAIVKSRFDIPTRSLCTGLPLVRILWGNFAFPNPSQEYLSLWLKKSFLGTDSVVLSNQFIASLHKTKHVASQNSRASIISRKKSIASWITTLNKLLFRMPLLNYLLSSKKEELKNAERGRWLMRCAKKINAGKIEIGRRS